MLSDNNSNDSVHLVMDKEEWASFTALRLFFEGAVPEKRIAKVAICCYFYFFNHLNDVVITSIIL